MKRESGMTAAVVKLNSLPDAIGAAAQNDDFLFLGWRGFVLIFIGRVQIRRVALELRGACVDALVNRHNAVLPAQMANLLLCPFTVEPPHPRQPTIGEAHTLGLSQHLSRNRFDRVLL